MKTNDVVIYNQAKLNKTTHKQMTKEYSKNDVLEKS